MIPGLNIHDQETISRIAGNWRLTPATFAQKVSKGAWIPAPWLTYASTRIAHGVARGGARIIISAPPRHGKTELVSVNTSAWLLENFPNKNVILAGYGSDLVEQSARRVRNIFWENTDILRCRVPRETSQVSAFMTSQNGYMFSVGLGGAITGRGANILLIDDYIKEIKEALSPTARDYNWNWFVTTAMTRLEPGASVIIIATRWHSDDLIGRILKNHPDKWENICLPALAMENDFLGRSVGEALFPERYPATYLEDQRELLGSIFFHALYQQGPVDEILKLANSSWLKVTQELPAGNFSWARVWDLAATEEGGDYTVGSLIGYAKDTGATVITNIVRKQISPMEVESTVKSTADIDGTDVTVCIEQEPGSSGKNLVQHYATNVLPEFRVVAIPSVKAKVVRAQPMLAAAEYGKVYLLNTTGRPEIPEWIAVFCSEFDEFPTGMHDDQIDTAAAGYTFLYGRKTMSAAPFRVKRNFDKPNSKRIRRASFMLGAGSKMGRGQGKLTFGR